MTAPHIVDPAHVLGNLLTQASPDMMRTLLQTLINALLSADADQVCGAEWGGSEEDFRPEEPVGGGAAGEYAAEFKGVHLDA